MLAQIAVIPSAPLLVPELAGPAATDTEPVRAAVLAAGNRLAQASGQWIAVGVGTGDHCAVSGDFGAYGVPVPIRLPHPSESTAPPPLSMLLAGWLAGQSRPQPSSVSPVIVDPETTPAAAGALGADLAAITASAEQNIGLLVVADGATALSPAAPGGGERASAWALQRRIDAAVAAVDPDGLSRLPVDECATEGVETRAAWQVLAGVLSSLPPMTSRVGYAAAPFGVGYTVATLQPVGTP
ncbi:hypothetical protein GOHSU_37_00050 [Gordonia hirsuta DSM 44140 = NBRC 16056]|uniref:Extradiol ring-cleavage dioxygenase class III enzyme subunit B domain-containing protein n=1 Tax=Gordonia hirsuta DSM 44140 = NBRC 16056 TaxID=1121927 RepID=L7LBJ8_9ACTN|nr:hypothetical protein [Gordonia hirsuta]GAC58309.1 hypothetical protein GOHSU_37_00050 [Gordonia hirsuta DSM 44140 = NBRC 16056]